MADSAPTLTSIIPSAAADIRLGVCGETIAAGQTIYIDTANSNVLKLAQHDGTALEATVAGLALCGGAVGQTIRYVTSDPNLAFTCGTWAVGDVLYCGSVYGGITETYADVTTGKYVTILGGCITAGTNIKLAITTLGLKP